MQAKPDYFIPTPNEIFKDLKEQINDELVDWFIREIVAQLKKIKNEYQLINFSMPRQPVNEETKTEVSRIFAEKGWEIIWKTRTIIKNRA